MEQRPSSSARTKVIATIGPACRQAEQLTELVLAGADLFRINTAHADRDEQGRLLATVRRVSRELKRPIAVLADLAGPKIRLGELPGEALECARDAEFRFVRGPRAKKPDELTTTYAPLVDELAVGDRLLLADGTVSMRVIQKTADAAVARVEQPGIVRSRQGLNLPGVKLSAPALGDVDRDNATWAADNDVDFVGLSFVRRAQDVRELKQLLRSRGAATRVIAKIEKPEAIDDLEAILEASDGVMVARGDLGVEIDVARMPIVQKQIVARARDRQKPVIIATQMLDSMQRASLPTRAEVTDVANAILDGGDACMLSGETAIGQFPREAVAMMNRIALATEELLRDNKPQPPGAFRAEGLHAVTAAIVYGAAHVATEIHARLVVVASHSGATALALSKQRIFVPTVGISDSDRTLRQMCLDWGVIPLAQIPVSSHQAMLDGVIAWGRGEGMLSPGDRVVLVAGANLGQGSHNQIIVHEVP
jgi:pyruvate kinase